MGDQVRVSANRSVLALAPLVVLLSACAPALTESLPECREAVASVTPIEGAPGLDHLISEDLARSVVACESVDEWITALRLNPEIVAVSRIDYDDGIVYLAGSCSLLDDLELVALPCEEGRRDGLFR